MYFISRHNKLFSYAVSIKPFYRYALSALALCAVAAVWFFGVYVQFNSHIAWYHAQLKQCAQQKTLVADSRKSIKQLKQSVALLDGLFNSHRAQACPNNSFHARVLDLPKGIRAHNLQLQNCVVNNEMNCEWYTKHSVAVDVRGMLPHLVSWFESLADSRNMIACDDMSLVRADDGQWSAKCALHLYEVN